MTLSLLLAIFLLLFLFFAEHVLLEDLPQLAIFRSIFVKGFVA